MKLEPTFGFLLNDAARLMRKRFEQRARSTGLTRSQWQALASLARNDGIQQGALAEILELEPITLVRILDRLEQAGYVERRRHPRDRRVWQLFLQPKTHPMLETMLALSEATRQETLAGIDEADRAVLLRCLQTMRANLASACLAPVSEDDVAHG